MRRAEQPPAFCGGGPPLQPPTGHRPRAATTKPIRRVCPRPYHTSTPCAHAMPPTIPTRAQYCIRSAGLLVAMRSCEPRGCSAPRTLTRATRYTAGGSRRSSRHRIIHRHNYGWSWHRFAPETPPLRPLPEAPPLPETPPLSREMPLSRLALLEGKQESPRQDRSASHHLGAIAATRAACEW